eukprot:snap_masked-scaffold_6-processed-gene-10.24-mRNA-1 protein AED:1.00 eAED:1.00 QI:0/0/0/0/1/1/2/0/102
MRRIRRQKKEHFHDSLVLTRSEDNKVLRISTGLKALDTGRYQHLHPVKRAVFQGIERPLSSIELADLNLLFTHDRITEVKIYILNIEDENLVLLLSGIPEMY